MKKLLVIGLISIFPVWLLQSGCVDFFEEDLSVSVVDMAVPSDSVMVVGPIVDFWWKSVPFSDGYEFQLVSPDFIKPVSVLADTMIVKNSIRFNLPPGSYRWRVRAYNQSSASLYTELTLYISQAK